MMHMSLEETSEAGSRNGACAVAKEKKKERTLAVGLECDCECASCDLGAHERCSSPRCHMPKWKDRRRKRETG